ncbi:MAG: hypothetical protein JSW28_05465, partial [Thermoplasmata archaeon]
GGNSTKFQFTGEDDIRPLYYGEHAVIRVSNWVGKTLVLNQQEVSDEERPIQPVRIAHHHNGNCGELQDLTTAAARTALIPAAPIMLLGEDHVWIEFYENGWHQWDNYWSDGGSVIDNFDNYWVGWGERGGSGILKFNGDDDTWEVTDQYIPEEDLSYVTIRVVDIDGDPVDGARVLALSYWLSVNIEGFQVDIPFPCIWNYTDANGETLFKLATQERPGGNHNFTFKIISKVGSAESGKEELEHGQDYYFTYRLEGSAPNPELDHDPQVNPDPPDPRYKLGIDYQVVKGVQRPRNLLTGHYHPEEIPPHEPPQSQVQDFVGNHVDSFIATGQAFTNFLRGESFESYEFLENSNSSTFEFVLTEDDDWYLVLSNRDGIETTKVVQLDLDLLYMPSPYSVKIVDPVHGSQLQIGDIIPISGILSNEEELTSLRISTDSGSTWFYLSPNGNQWSYNWDTASLDLGWYTIVVEATFGAAQDFDSIDVELMDLEPPDLIISEPPDYSEFNIGDVVRIAGTATDDMTITSLEMSTDGGGTWIDIISGLSGGYWSSNWYTSSLEPGSYVVQVRASDGNNEQQDSVHIDILDSNPPSVTISSPANNSKLNVGDVIPIAGEAEDNRNITRLQLEIHGEESPVNVISSLNNTKWTHEWDTAGLSLGWYTLTINASDGTYNSSHSIDVELIDSEAPDIAINYPEDGATIGIGTSIIIKGVASDNVGITQLELATKGSDWEDILHSLSGGQWSYEWSTEGYALGTTNIKLRASDGIFQSSDTISVELVDATPPLLTITNPAQGQDINSGDVVTVSGTASDDFAVPELKITFDSGATWVDILPSLSNGEWSYTWDTAGLQLGSLTLKVTAEDGANEPTFDQITVNIKDLMMPELEITSPEGYSEYDTGAVIPIMGRASDNTQLTELRISTDNGRTWSDILPELRNGRWHYDWDTEDLESGTYVVRVRAHDGTYEVEESVTVVLEKEKEEGGEELNLSLIILLLLIGVILIIVTVVVFAVSRGRKKKEFAPYEQKRY